MIIVRFLSNKSTVYDDTFADRSVIVQKDHKYEIKQSSLAKTLPLF